MNTKQWLGYGAIVVAAIILFAVPDTPTLTDSEQVVLDALRDVYGEHITSEEITRDQENAIANIKLRGEAIPEMNVNLTSLGQDVDDGLTIPVLKMALRYDSPQPASNAEAD